MVERGRLPCGSRMALRTELWIPHGLMIRIAGARIVGAVAVNAICGQARVLIVHMAVFAKRCPMSSSQHKFRRIVVKGRWLPDAGRMACLTRVAETCDNVDRGRRLGVVSLMALVAIGVRKLIIAADVA